MNAKGGPGDTRVATTILQQLGGNRFIAMTGAKYFTSYPDALVFRLPKARKQINVVKITLMPSDTYKMEFMKVRAMKLTTIETVEDVYFDALQDVFTRVTGLYTRL